MSSGSAIMQNVTNDDFDSMLTYSDLALFETPNPSNASTRAQYASYFDGTYHSTTSPNASISYTFQGTDLYVYGAVGANSSFLADLDGNSTTVSASNAQNSSSYLLLSRHGLDNSVTHTYTMTNIAGSMLLDFVKATIELAPTGATVVNTTLDDRNMTRLNYTGVWNYNSVDSFYGGTSTYTNASGASVSASFYGSAVYVTGDQNNDHGFFNVTLDGVTRTLRTPNGCRGVEIHGYCEKINPGYQFWAANLGPELHNITITNVLVPERNESYFDLDRIIYTTPSSYLNISASNGTSVRAIGAAGDQPSSASAASQASSLLLLLYVFIASLFM